MPENSKNLLKPKRISRNKSSEKKSSSKKNPSIRVNGEKVIESDLEEKKNS